LTLTYKTSRLSVVEFFADTLETEIFVAVMELLSPKVTEYLPPYFNNINSILSAKEWVEKMMSESRLFIVKHTDTNTIIGFIFIFNRNDTDAHIGYLLGESYWGKGYAAELLKGLIYFITHENKVNRLIAGVSTNNIASCKLLKKLDFIKGVSANNETIFYEYLLPNHNKIKKKPH